MLKKLPFSPAQPWRAETRLFPGNVLASKHPQRSPLGEQAVLAAWGGWVRRATPPVLSSAAALLDGLFEHPAGVFPLEARNICASAILDGQHDEVFFSNRVDNPIAALANPIEMVHAFKFCYARRTRVAAECMEPFHEKRLKRFGECPELLLSRRGHKNCGDCLAQSEPQFFQNDIKRLGALLVRLGQGCAGIDEIDTIFQSLQES